MANIKARELFSGSPGLISMYLHLSTPPPPSTLPRCVGVYAKESVSVWRGVCVRGGGGDMCVYEE